MLTELITKIEDLPLEDLIILKNRIEGAIKVRQEEKRKTLLAEFRQIAERNGLSLDEVLTANGFSGGKKKRRARSPMPIKYRDPQNPENTWTGMGRKPRWLENYLANGGRLEDCAI